MIFDIRTKKPRLEPGFLLCSSYHRGLDSLLRPEVVLTSAGGIGMLAFLMGPYLRPPAAWA